MIADLHCHTHFSDGTFSPGDLVRMALNKGLRYLAVSDHDHLGGITQAHQAAQGTPLEIVPAVEINTDWGKDEVHILGYFVDPLDAELNEVLANQRKSRELRLAAIVEKLWNLGIAITLDQVRTMGKGTLGRPHIAFALVEMGLADSVKEAFEKFLVRGAPAYVPRRPDSMNPLEAIQVIRKAGGVGVMAHPGATKDFSSVLTTLIEAGLEGVEVYHPQNPLPVSIYLLELARRHNLLVTGGSDFHGDKLGPSKELGCGELTREHIQNLKEWVGK